MYPNSILWSLTYFEEYKCYSTMRLRNLNFTLKKYLFWYSFYSNCINTCFTFVSDKVEINVYTFDGYPIKTTYCNDNKPVRDILSYKKIHLVYVPSRFDVIFKARYIITSLDKTILNLTSYRNGEFWRSS